MCKFFSFVTEPDGHPNERFYFDWDYRKKHLKLDDADSHDHIITKFKLHADKVNGYEFNPLTGKFEIDNIRSEINDSIQAEKWVKKVDFKTIVELLIIKPIINPFELKASKKPTKEQIELLKNWVSVLAGGYWGAGAYCGSRGRYASDARWAASTDVGGRAGVGASVWDSVVNSVESSVSDVVSWSSIGAYSSTFIDTKYKLDYSSHNKLWESGLVPIFDGKTWRLHSGKKGKIIYEISAEELGKK